MNTEREKIRKNLKNRIERCQKREKRFDLYLNPILRHTVWPDNFFCKIEKIGHPQIKLGRSGEIWIWRSKSPKHKITKNRWSFLAIFGKTVGHKGLKFSTGSFLTRIYNFVFEKSSRPFNFILGCDPPFFTKKSYMGLEKIIGLFKITWELYMGSITGVIKVFPPTTVMPTITTWSTTTTPTSGITLWPVGLRL